MLYLKPGRLIFNDDGKCIRPEEILQHVFSDPVRSIDGWTLRDLMEYIQPYGIVFGEMAKCDYSAFYEEMNGPKPSQDDSDKEFVNNIKYINVSRHAEFQDSPQMEICEYIHVDGRNDEATDGGQYAIEFTSVALLADLPIKIDDSFKVQRSITGDWNDKRDILTCKKPLYLLDIIWGILWEISFFGSPEKRDEKLEDLEDRMDDVKAGTAQTISATEFFDRLSAEIEAEGYANDGVGPYGAD